MHAITERLVLLEVLSGIFPHALHRCVVSFRAGLQSPARQRLPPCFAGC